MSAKPKLFIGSSAQGLAAARALGQQLNDYADVRLCNDLFRLGSTTVATLLQELDRCDYAVLIATRDDVVGSNGAEADKPRDNVVFEAGLFMGRLGPNRTFLLRDVHAELSLPSDLDGLSVASFDASSDDLGSATRKAANKLITSLTDKVLVYEVDFLRSYLRLVPPDIRTWHTYADILDRHFRTMQAEVDRLRRNEDWAQLLEVKGRLREYFEFSGKYTEGAEFGRAYVEALTVIGREHEADWSRIKDIGYMLILAGKHAKGRKAIKRVLENANPSPKVQHSKSESRMLFYAHRYLGISYQRDTVGSSLEKAKESFDVAETFISSFPTTSKDYVALRARILRNFGNLSLAEGRSEEAIAIFQTSLKLFKQLEDVEHMGFSHLKIGEARISSSNDLDAASSHLKKAHGAFAQLGCIEGLARVDEQYARLHAAVAAKCKKRKRRERSVEAALSAATSARNLFDRMGAKRACGRIDSLVEGIQALNS